MPRAIPWLLCRWTRLPLDWKYLQDRAHSRSQSYADQCCTSRWSASCRTVCWVDFDPKRQRAFNKLWYVIVLMQSKLSFYLLTFGCFPCRTSQTNVSSRTWPSFPSGCQYRKKPYSSTLNKTFSSKKPVSLKQEYKNVFDV